MPRGWPGRSPKWQGRSTAASGLSPLHTAQFCTARERVGQPSGEVATEAGQEERERIVVTSAVETTVGETSTGRSTRLSSRGERHFDSCAVEESNPVHAAVRCLLEAVLCYLQVERRDMGAAKAIDEQLERT
ncbi:uncharacterized protein BDZ99DRAFT_481413 [Mytilinidion resinicola]|uniref:Uncharacterized protein n=1 Tax=Mytilinidion resinicola TaxID=574789 RepID=A0A6A6Y5Z2_9PEZI|nr:uncharacterized protein BDZ99DRAFT_481413 [Mytilinidion resinicola]KAF2804261.1 hypothetical protein BDZ99DRAFT_481413 [Mytilinidion resinicola]